MIEIKKVENAALAEKVCKENGIEYHENYRVIATLDGGNILQSAVFTYENEQGSIHAISGFDGDIMLLDGLCRAILNIMDINGVKEVCLPHKYDKLAQYVGFSKEDDRYRLELEGFFQCGCCNKKGD